MIQVFEKQEKSLAIFKLGSFLIYGKCLRKETGTVLP